MPQNPRWNRGKPSGWGHRLPLIWELRKHGLRLDLWWGVPDILHLRRVSWAFTGTSPGEAQRQAVSAVYHLRKRGASSHWSRTRVLRKGRGRSPRPLHHVLWRIEWQNFSTSAVVRILPNFGRVDLIRLERWITRRCLSPSKTESVSGRHTLAKVDVKSTFIACFKATMSWKKVETEQPMATSKLSLTHLSRLNFSVHNSSQRRKKMAKKKKTRNPIAGVLALPCFKKRVVQNKKAYSRKENTRAVTNTFRDGSFYIKQRGSRPRCL